MTAPDPTAQRRASLALLAALVVAGCRTTAPAPGPAPDWIVVAGERFPIGTRVVTWQEPGGYSAYLRGKHFVAEDDEGAEPDGKRRYSTRPGLPEDREPTLDDVQQVVHQFVLHYDVCGSSRQCFKVLQDVRTLSVHFLLDLDGTIYQTLDVREKAWHATIANDFSVGVEIAHPGAYPQPLSAAMRTWYEQDEQGWRQKFPAWMTETGIRTAGFVARPDRPHLVSGFVQTRTYYQFDFTSEQYAALARLAAGLNRALPRIRLEAPRTAAGTIVDRALPEAELRAFDGIVGHFHVQRNKQDPGPAFQWPRLLLEARELRRDE